MLNVKEKGILINIIKHCNRIEEKVAGIKYENFSNDEDLKEIVCFNILQIGELSKKLGKDFCNLHPEQPWSNIAGMRDVVVHGYGTIKIDRVWKTANEDIVPLRAYCQKIIDQSDSKSK